MKIINISLLGLIVYLFSAENILAASKNLCVFDLLGANGPVYALMQDYKIAALGWGVDLKLKPYVSERQAAEDFKAGLCDVVSFTGTQSREFNAFSGSLDAVGALSSYEHLKTVISNISSEQARPLLVSEPYEVVGIIPMGAVYLFVNDRSLVVNHVDTQGDLKNVRVAIMEGDPVQAELIGFIGTSFEESSIAEMYSKFNHGAVDVTYGPAVVYEAMELYKGLSPKGGIIRFPVAQLTLQIMIWQERFSDQFAQKSRDYALGQFDNAVLRAKNYENRIAPIWWIEIPPEDQLRYHKMFRDTRMRLLKKGVYDEKMLTVMQMVRCQKDPSRQECSETLGE
ncbi:MAG: putative solute-binding protein [Gammaproteobacteria bacterium]